MGTPFRALAAMTFVNMLDNGAVVTRRRRRSRAKNKAADAWAGGFEIARVPGGVRPPGKGAGAPD